MDKNKKQFNSLIIYQKPMYKMQLKTPLLCETEINNKFIFIHDKEEDEYKTTKNHVDFGDYFATLATIINLINESEQEAVNDLNKIRDRNKKFLKEIKRHLMFLQKNYKINKK